MTAFYCRRQGSIWRSWKHKNKISVITWNFSHEDLHLITLAFGRRKKNNSQSRLQLL